MESPPFALTMLDAIDALGALADMLDAHGFLSTEKGELVECQCRACVEAGAVIDRVLDANPHARSPVEKPVENL